MEMTQSLTSKLTKLPRTSKPLTARRGAGELTFADFCQNIRTIYANATEQHQRDGLAWYGSARTLAEDLATELGLDLEQVAGVIAAMSPQCPWKLQVQYTKELITGLLRGLDIDEAVHPGTRANKAKVVRILAGEKPLDVLGGIKVRTFYENILGSDRHKATLDVWAIRVCLMDAKFTDERDLGGSKIGDEMRLAYQLVAKELGLETAALQATVWVTFKDLGAQIANGRVQQAMTF